MGYNIIDPEYPSSNYYRYKKPDSDTDQGKDYIIRIHFACD